MLQKENWSFDFKKKLCVWGVLLECMSGCRACAWCLWVSLGEGVRKHALELK